MTTSKQRLGLAATILLMVTVAVWVASAKRGHPSVQAGKPVKAMPEDRGGVSPANAPAKLVVAPDPWTRPSAKVVARHLRRARLSLLKKFGASEKLVDRLTDGDAPAAIEELKQQARRGDPSAANILEYMAYSICGFLGVNGGGSPSQAQQLMDAADAGYPDAQAFLAQGLMNGTAHLPAGSLDAGPLRRDA